MNSRFCSNTRHSTHPVTSGPGALAAAGHITAGVHGACKIIKWVSRSWLKDRGSGGWWWEVPRLEVAAVFSSFFALRDKYGRPANRLHITGGRGHWHVDVNRCFGPTGLPFCAPASLFLFPTHPTQSVLTPFCSQARNSLSPKQF